MAQLTLDELKALSHKFSAYFDELNKHFVGRKHILELLKYAVAQRQHILLFGPPGTSKTKLCDAVFGGITGAQNFQVEMSMYMGEDAIFGPFDTRKMREDGVLMHRIEGMLPEAHFARIGEFLDANAAVLRSLLSSLHERQMRRGKQIVNMPLLTVYCDTNVDPLQYLKKHPQAWAVFDRIMFMERLEYLVEGEELTEMVERFQHGIVNRFPGKLSMGDINSISETIVLPPTLITSKIMFVKYGEAIAEYRLKRAELVKKANSRLILPEISDRRICIASQMMEVSAVLDGRLEAQPQDMCSVAHAIGTTEEERELWQKIVAKKIEEIGAQEKQQLKDAQLMAIVAIEEQMQNVSDKTPTAEATHIISVLGTQLSSIVGDSAAVEKKKATVMKQLEVIKGKVRQKLLDENGLS